MKDMFVIVIILKCTAKQLKALKVVLEAIGGLWLESVSDGLYLSLVCKFQLRGSRVHALILEVILCTNTKRLRTAKQDWMYQTLIS